MSEKLLQFWSYRGKSGLGEFYPPAAEIRVVYIYGSYRKIKTGVHHFFGPPCNVEKYTSVGYNAVADNSSVSLFV